MDVFLSILENVFLTAAIACKLSTEARSPRSGIAHLPSQLYFPDYVNCISFLGSCISPIQVKCIFHSPKKLLAKIDRTRSNIATQFCRSDKVGIENTFQQKEEEKLKKRNKKDILRLNVAAEMSWGRSLRVKFPALEKLQKKRNILRFNVAAEII